MFYRVTLDYSFPNKADADTLSDFARALLPKAKNINEGKRNEERSYIETHTCLHEEDGLCVDKAIIFAPRVKEE